MGKSSRKCAPRLSHLFSAHRVVASRVSIMLRHSIASAHSLLYRRSLARQWSLGSPSTRRRRTPSSACSSDSRVRMMPTLTLASF